MTAIIVTMIGIAFGVFVVCLAIAGDEGQFEKDKAQIEYLEEWRKKHGKMSASRRKGDPDRRA